MSRWLDHGLKKLRISSRSVDEAPSVVSQVTERSSCWSHVVVGMGLKSKKLTKQSYRKLLQESIDTGVPFSDQEFKAVDSSLFGDRNFLSDVGVGRVVWKRPLELVRDPHLLFREKVSHSSLTLRLTIFPL